MANPEWPNKKLNYRQVKGGIECTMSTHYNGVDLSVSLVRDDITKAEKATHTALQHKVNERKRFEQ